MITIPASALTLMLLAAGFAPPQARAVVAYSWGESRLQPCANSVMGEGLFGVAGLMRRAAHADAHVVGCIPVETQVAFMAREWPRLYPECSARFAAGDLGAFRWCWGLGHRR